MATSSRSSFRLMLTHRYVASFCFLLLILGCVTYCSLYQSQLQSLDRSLLSIAQSEADFATQNAKLHLHRTHDVLPGQGSYSLPRYVQITDLQGRILASNHGFTYSPFVLVGAELAPKVSEHPLFTQRKIKQETYRLVFLAIEQGGQRYSLQVATPLAPLYETLKQVMGVFVLASLGILALATWLGWRLAERAVTPLEQIARLTSQIDLQQLHQRLPERPDSPQELHLLTAQLNRMFQRLEQSAQALQQFTADASHELRTPLTVLKGEIQVALRKPRENQEYRDLLSSNLEEVNRLIHLVAVLLQLSRSEELAHEGQLLPGQTELGHFLSQMVQRWQETAQSRQIVIDLDLSKAPVWLAVHPAYLEQIFANLCDNALRFSPQGAHLGVTLLQEAGNAGFALQDQGPGIAEAEQPRIFERFYQVNQARTSNRQNFGIGLSLCKTLVEAHGGKICLQSKPQQGSRFEVLFPQADYAA